MSKRRASGQGGALSTTHGARASQKNEEAAHTASVSLARTLSQLCWEAGKSLFLADYRVPLGRQMEELGVRGSWHLGDNYSSLAPCKLRDGDKTEAWSSPFCLQGLTLEG